jgi:hypothetical protein
VSANRSRCFAARIAITAANMSAPMLISTAMTTAPHASAFGIKSPRLNVSRITNKNKFLFSAPLPRKSDPGWSNGRSWREGVYILSGRGKSCPFFLSEERS